LYCRFLCPSGILLEIRNPVAVDARLSYLLSGTALFLQDQTYPAARQMFPGELRYKSVYSGKRVQYYCHQSADIIPGQKK
jgi:hypothetical protein